MESLEALHLIMQLIENRIGMKSQSISLLKWEWIIKERMALCNLTAYEDYYQLLRSSEHESQEFLELVVVPETWFFRDKAGIEFLIETVKKNFYPSFKILCLPCSTGEEPYSIAMMLSEAKIPSNSFSIDAADVSQKSLVKAQIGLYGKNSFRGKEFQYRDRYFYEYEGEYAIDERIKKQVQFYFYNIMQKKIIFEARSYHFIFFRNLLIYLTPRAQQKAFHLIRYLLHPDGFLLVGPAEVALAQSAGFDSVPYTRGYVLKLNSGSQNQENTQKPAILSAEQEFFFQKKHQAYPNLIQGTVNQQDKGSITAGFNKAELLQEASRLADKGRFKEATDYCLKYVYQYGGNPEVYYLLGLIQHALGQELKAEEYFRKVVYLDPFHYESLVYIALLLERKGNLDQASLFRARAQKAYKHDK